MFAYSVFSLIMDTFENVIAGVFSVHLGDLALYLGCSLSSFAALFGAYPVEGLQPAGQ